MNRRDFIKSFLGLSIIPLSCAEISKEKGETIILKYPSILSFDQKERIVKEAEKAFPNKKVVLLDGGLDIQVLKNDQDNS